jgi:hypothetical protein
MIWGLAFQLGLWGFTPKLATGFNMYILMYFFSKNVWPLAIVWAEILTDGRSTRA